jgi:hypothetical protein
MKRIVVGALACACLLSVGGVRPVQADEVPRPYRVTVKKALTYLARAQAKDGHWEADNESYPVAVTALAGIALLMEGSTIREGKYADNIKRAADWLTRRERLQQNGLIGDMSNPRETERYMYGHGFATLFLACIYGEEEGNDQRLRLRAILTQAVKFIGAAQSSKGGWYYTSAKECNDDDEGSVTITQLQALRACRNAGIPVSKEIIEKARTYLKKSTASNGGVYYSLDYPQVRESITAAAIACGFSAGEYKSPLVKKWLLYCKGAIHAESGRMAHDEYTHYYYAQTVYLLGDKGYGKLFPRSNPKDRLTWTKYRKALFSRLKRTQNKNGSWTGNAGIGPVYVTALYATVMQLDNAALPIYQR